MDKLPLWAKILIAVVTCLAIGFLSGLSTTDAIGNWYAGLNKPFFNPPNWLFAPAWSLLYTLMGISAALVWHQGLSRPEVKNALLFFGIQLVLNFFWSIIFFGLEQPMFALIEIILLWGFILVTILKFHKIHKVAAYLLIPYLAWVTFATALNAAIVYLN